MAMWVGIWAAIAGPAFLIYAVSGKERNANVPLVVQGAAILCKECGKYYNGPADFCPSCGKPTKGA